MSNAIHSEVIELLMTTDKFEKAVLTSYDALAELVDKASRPIPVIANNAKFIQAIDDNIARIQLMNEQLQKQNEIVRQQIRLSEQAKGAASRTVSNTMLPGFLTTQANNRAAMGSLEHSVGGGNSQQVANAVAANVAREAAARQAAEQSAYAALKADLARRERAHMDNLHNERQVAMAKLASEQRIANEARIQRERDYASLKADLAKRAEATARMGYGVGSALTGAKTNSLLSGAGMLSFGAGANSLGGMFFMAERLTSQLGIGNKSLGVYAEKLGLVKLSGEGAEASIAAFGARAVTAAGALALMAAPIATMFAGNKLNVALAEMSTLLADVNVSGEKFATILNETNAAAIRLSGSFNNNIVDTVNGFKLALSSGIDAPDLERFGQVAMTMGKGLGATFEQSTSILTTFKDAFHGTVEDTVGYSDVLFNAINVGKFNVTQLTSSLGRVVVTAAEAGVSVKDMMASLATLTRVGMTTSNAVTSLNQMIVSITNPSEKAAKQFDRLGIAYGSAALRGRSLVSVIAEIKAKIGSNEDMFGELFPEERGRRGAIGLAANPSLSASNRNAMDESGTSMKAAERAMDTFSEKFGQIFTTIWSVVQAIGSDLLNVARDVFFPGGPLNAETLAPLRNMVEELGVALKLIGVILIDIVGIAYNAVKAIVSSIIGITDMLSGTLAKGFAEFRNGWMDLGKSIINGVTSFGTTVEATAQRMVSNISEVAKGAVSDITDTAAAATNVIPSMFGDDATKAIDALEKKATSAFDSIAKSIRKARMEASDLAFGSQYKDPTVQGKANADPAIDEMMGKLQRGHALKNDPKYWTASEESQRKQEQSANALVLSDAEEADMYRVLHARRMQEIERNADAERKKLREEARKTWMIANGFGKEMAEEEATKAYKNKPAGAGVFNDKLAEYLDGGATAIASIKNKTSLKSRVGGYVAGADDAKAGVKKGDLVSVYEEVTDVVKKLQIAEAAAAAARMEYNRSFRDNTFKDLEEQKNALTLIEAMEKDNASTRATVSKDLLKAAQAEYDASVKLHTKKLSLYEQEVKKADAAVAHWDAVLSKLDDRKQARAGEQNPGRQYRADVSSIDSQISAASRIKDSKQLSVAEANLRKDIDRMVANGGAAGFDKGRTGSIATDFEDRIAAIVTKARNADAISGKKASSGIVTEDAKWRNDILANPVSKAAIAQAGVVIKDMMGKAAEHGIGVAGNLVSNVDIKGIQINLPVAELTRSITETVKAAMIVYVNDMTRDNGNKKAPGDLGRSSDPIGASRPASSIGMSTSGSIGMEP